MLGEAGLKTLPHVEPHNVSAWAQYTIRVADRDRVQKSLSEAGVPTAVHYPIPLNKQPAVEDLTILLPIGDAVAREVMSLPMHPNLSQASVGRIVSALISC
jgi:UDP-2-acetamido-2-deoxy-ribo-hexuluronate aminotransferase